MTKPSHIPDRMERQRLVLSELVARHAPEFVGAAHRPRVDIEPKTAKDVVFAIADLERLLKDQTNVSMFGGNGFTGRASTSGAVAAVRFLDGFQELVAQLAAEACVSEGIEVPADVAELVARAKARRVEAERAESAALHASAAEKRASKRAVSHQSPVASRVPSCLSASVPSPT